MQVDLCRHIKATGLQCRAVALKSSVFCYFHNRLQRAHDTYRDKAYLYPHRVEMGNYIQLLPLEDAASVQIAISSVVNALATDCITEKRAYALFNGLYLASANAHRMRRVRKPNQLVRDTYKESSNTIPEASPDIAPPGRTIELEEPIDEVPEQTGCPVLTPLGRDADTPPTPPRTNPELPPTSTNEPPIRPVNWIQSGEINKTPSAQDTEGTGSLRQPPTSPPQTPNATDTAATHRWSSSPPCMPSSLPS